jgi:DNA (cytosine-5)-methyltransferase 1
MSTSTISVTDLFCGAGGSSSGAAAAGGDVRMAINHWQLAVETHNTNFPQTDHDVNDISAVDPRRYPSTTALIGSPECTNHTQAKGKSFQQKYSLFGEQPDPSEERSRATMWDIPRIIVENVVEARKWRPWDGWIQAMDCLGYHHEVVYFNSMFAWPTPQSRDRMYVVFWKKGNKKPDLSIKPLAYCHDCGRNVEAVQSWKNPHKRWGKWGRYGKRGQYWYRCPSCTEIVEPYYFCAANAIDWSLPAPRIGDRKRPLKPKTLARIETGLKKFAGQTVLVDLSRTHGHNNRATSVTSPTPTQQTANTLGIGMPFVLDTLYTHSEKPPKGVDVPLPSQTGRQTLAVGVPKPFIYSFYSRENVAAGVDEAIGTFPTEPRHALAVPPFMVELFGTGSNRSIERPLGGITAQGNNYAVAVPKPFLVGNYTPGTHIDPNSPMGAITSVDHHSVAVPAPVLVGHYSSPTVSNAVTDPVGSLTQIDKHSLVLPAAFLMSYYGTDNYADIIEAMGTQSTVDRHALVAKKSSVEDCGFRMLQPHEIGKGMAFPGDYVVLGTKRDQVKQYGAAVTPPVMELLFSRCKATLE